MYGAVAKFPAQATARQSGTKMKIAEFVSILPSEDPPFEMKNDCRLITTEDDEMDV